MLKNPYEIWAYLKEKGGLDENKYDLGLINELKSNLELNADYSIEKSLKECDLSNEQFLSVFFNVVQPYAEMLGDLLKLFSELGAKQTNDNINIKFDFDNSLHDFNFDIEAFKDWIEAWENVYGKIKVRQWDMRSLWELDQCLRLQNALKTIELPEEVQRWSYEYRQLNIWPDFFPPKPISGDSSLDTRLERIWKIWKTVVKESSRYGESRNALREFKNNRDELEENTKTNSELNSLNKNWPYTVLRGLDSDFWSDAIISRLHQSSKILKDEIAKGNTKFINQFIESVDEAFNQTNVIEQEANYLVQVIEEFLKLPFWNRRHELYSVWVFSQIYHALADYPVKVHITNDSLIFSFSGSHLATISGNNNFHVWSELRSKIKNPIGKGRKYAIQPDYSIIGEPITSPDSSILEIECKQYFKPSYKNFSDALNDYAKGRPKANVILVNYGYISDIILEKIDSKYLPRVCAIGCMRPGVQESTNRFKEKIIETLCKHCDVEPNQKTTIPLDSLIGKTEIQLTWGSKPEDLDLHIYIIENNKTHKIYYDNQGDILKFPYCQLDKDITSGKGPEIIRISKWEKAKYYCVVNKYSNDSSFAESNAKVSLKINNTEYQINCPKDEKGKWWNVFQINTNTQTLKIVNRISEQPLIDKVLFEDDFKENKYGWAETETDHEFKFKNNCYLLSHKRDYGAWYSTNKISIPQNKNFEIQAEIKILNDNIGSFYRFIVDYQDVENYLAFCINSKGQFSIIKRVKNNDNSLVSWTYSDYIKKDSNSLAIKKMDEHLHFIANEVEMCKIEFTPFNNSRIGFGLDKNISVEVYKMIIMQNEY